MRESYYFPDNGQEVGFFGPAGEWTCMNYAALVEFARNCGEPVESIVGITHEATKSELETYGVYDA